MTLVLRGLNDREGVIDIDDGRWLFVRFHDGGFKVLYWWRKDDA